MNERLKELRKCLGVNQEEFSTKIGVTRSAISRLEARTQDITLQAEREKRETTEFIEILKTMSESERQQIKGVMIGIQLSKGTVRTA